MAHRPEFIVTIDREKRDLRRSAAVRGHEATLQEGSVPGWPLMAAGADAQTKRLTNARAVSATSRQPLSIVSECPRFGIFLISVTPSLRRCLLKWLIPRAREMHLMRAFSMPIVSRTRV